MKSQIKKNQAAFTLIELLVVISIIGILSTLVLANLFSARERARDATRKSDLRNIQTALRLYYNDNGQYPPDDGAGNIKGCGTKASPTLCGSTQYWGVEWISSGGTVYMSTLPKDPLPDQSYNYDRIDASDS